MYFIRYCITFFVLYVFSSGFTQAKEKFDYYWRDYHGKIPDDAVPGGLDKNNKTTYIGSMFVVKNGIFPTRIYPGYKDVISSYYGIHRNDKFIKILCAPNHENFVWVPTNASEFYVTTIGKRVIEGGMQNHSILNIGRAQYQDELIVGKISAYRASDTLLRFPYDNKEIYLDTYEVLTFENKAPLVDHRQIKS